MLIFNLQSYSWCITVFTVNHRHCQLLRPRAQFSWLCRAFTLCLSGLSISQHPEHEISGSVVLPWKYYLDTNNTCFHETMKAVHSWPWWLEWLEGCGCWVEYSGTGAGAGGEAGVSELRAHFRETHLFTLSSPDGRKSLSQHPADCFHRLWIHEHNDHFWIHEDKQPKLHLPIHRTCMVFPPNLLHFVLHLDLVTPEQLLINSR